MELFITLNPAVRETGRKHQYRHNTQSHGVHAGRHERPKPVMCTPGPQGTCRADDTFQNDAGCNGVALIVVGLA
jgi:hypothetical protein